MTEPTDKELEAFAVEEQFLLFCDVDEFTQIARAVLAKWGTQPAGAGEKVYLVATGLTNEAGTVGLYERHEKFVPLADCEVLYTTPQPTQAQAGAITPPQIECNTEELKRAYAFGWWSALEKQRETAQAGAVPLTPEQVAEIADAAHREYDRLVASGQCAPRWSAVFAHLLESAHGIGIKGGQHGAE